MVHIRSILSPHPYVEAFGAPKITARLRQLEASGYVEADLVFHSGPSAGGDFVQTLVLTKN